MGEEDLADPVLLNLDHIDLARFEVVGNYVRFDEKTRHALKDFRRKVMAGFDGSLGSKENYLIWGPPGSGKTFLVQELARSMGAPAYVELNLAESNEGRFRASLDILESTPQPTLCLVDEADSKAEESWPYELLLRHLEPPEERRKRVCFILAGSSGGSLEEMTAAIRQRPKGADLLSRIPADHRLAVPSLTEGDRTLVTLVQLLHAAAERGRLIREVEKMAVFYATANAQLESARQLRDFAISCARRIPQGEDRIRYDDLFDPGDPENKEFWIRTQQDHGALVNRYLTVQMAQVPQDLGKRFVPNARLRIAVLPLSSISPDPGDEYFADGMTEELISAVSKIGDLRTTSRTSAMRYKGSKKSVGEIASELGVGSVLEGSVRKTGNSRTSSPSKATSPTRWPKPCRFTSSWTKGRGSRGERRPTWRRTASTSKGSTIDRRGPRKVTRERSDTSRTRSRKTRASPSLTRGSQSAMNGWARRATFRPTRVSPKRRTSHKGHSASTIRWRNLTRHWQL